MLAYSSGFERWLDVSPAASVINAFSRALLGGVCINMMMVWATERSKKELVARLEKEVAGYDESNFKL